MSYCDTFEGEFIHWSLSFNTYYDENSVTEGNSVRIRYEGENGPAATLREYDICEGGKCSLPCFISHN